MLRITGLVLLVKGLLSWMSLIGIMYSYADRGIIKDYFTLFLIINIFFVASIFLGIYFSELGTMLPNKLFKKRILTLRKDIPARRVGIFLFFEIIGSILIFLIIPEFPKLWIFIVVEFITCVLAMKNTIQ